MAVYLSPGVFTREINLGSLPSSVGPLRPAFLGAFKKGPMNVATLVANPQQAIQEFGEPFPESPAMYAILAFMEEGGEAYVMRVGVEEEAGQPAALDDICIDTSGSRVAGWGRIPLFSGIDFGRLNLRAVDTDNPAVFHNASVSTPVYNDSEVSDTDGATDADLQTSGTYTGTTDDSFIMVITGSPATSDAAAIDGATFEIIRNSDGEIVAEGTLIDPGDATSQWIDIGSGLEVRVVVTDGFLAVNDTFTFSAAPNNRNFSVAIEGDATPVTYTMPLATYTTAAGLVAAFNNLLSGEDYLMVEYELADGTTIPQLRSDVAGERIQLMGTAAWASELGTQRYVWDIPRSYLLGTEVGPYNISTQNNRVALQVIGTTTKLIEFNAPIGSGQTADSVASTADLAGTVAGATYFESFTMTVPGGDELVVIVTSSDHQFDTLRLRADFTYLKTLRFAEELGIAYPYKRSYRGFNDSRLELPPSGQTTASEPLSCEDDEFSADCASDTAYFANIVGWLVAPSPGTWLTGYTVTLELYTEGVGDTAGRYKIVINDDTGAAVESIDDVSFDKREARYIGNVVNPRSRFGGTNGNQFAHWEERPSFLNNDVELDDFEVRQPSQFTRLAFRGMADGIPLDPAYSSELDAAIIGNPATSTGLYAFQNPETIDINLLCTPGFSSGAVIGTALQICESRGDVYYIVDPPFGLRPQQVVDWHNGILLSDLQAAINSSFGGLYWGWIRVFDQFSNEQIWIPPSGHVCAVYSRTARDSEVWSAPAGLRRGRLLTALDVEYAPSQGERNLLYGSGNAVNPIVKFPQEGIVVWGQRTLQRSSSPTDRANVRMLLIDIKKNAQRILRDFIFEPNDRILWAQASAALNPYLADIQARRGLQGYRVVIDESNNTPERISRHELWVSLFLIPTETVEFIVLNMVSLRNSGSFSSEEVLAAGGIITGTAS